MQAAPRRQLSYASFLALLVLDVSALISLFMVQVLGAPMPIAWLVAAVLTGMLSPVLLQVSDKLFEMARSDDTIPRAGESFL